jgi:2-oxoglutarate dehydrogenase E1 component
MSNSLNLNYAEALYRDYLRDPASVAADWRRYFDSFEEAREDGARGRRDANGAALSAVDSSSLQSRVDQVIWNYRVRGHMMAKLNPLEGSPASLPELEPAFYGFTDADMERPVFWDTLGGAPVKLAEVFRRLRETYCRSIGAQFMHIDDLAAREWLQERMERSGNRLELGREEQIRILTRLTDAVIFEEFIRKKFIGAKTFSLEGAESLIPLLDLAIERAAEQGIREVVMGMAHRGRLNVLANIIGKSPREIFWEFEDAVPDPQLARGDVKYHLGHSNDWVSTSGRKVHLSLAFNPSHLEFVDPVVPGRTRAKQDRAGDREGRLGMALVIHGDAGFAGEGVVQETLNLSRLEGYGVGGTLHVVINNQIGFTTSPSEARSSVYATDVAKLLQSPIFHVNGEDPEAVAQVVRLSMDFRREFQSDVVIDMYGYRKLGHNEGDEPSFTQPLLYRRIGERRPLRESYLEHLLELGKVTREEAEQIAERRRIHLEEELSEARSRLYLPSAQTLGGVWSGYKGGPESEADEVETGVRRERLVELLIAQTRLPEGFHPHPKITRGIEARREMAAGKRPIDWSAAESLAFATLATEGIRVRLSGQDSARGTFSQRHAVLHDFESGRLYVPLQHVSAEQAPVEIYNSPLSEAGVLGFDYGYSLDCPDGLILWEAQFGDFCNAAQVIVDQFIASAEKKWRRLSGIVLLLPHGFEGMGPEHSSARLERFLQLAAEDNLQIVYPTTPAQYFHCLRRQALRRWRKPLVVMTPKSLLRHPKVVSEMTDLERGSFRKIIGGAEKVERVLLASGKIARELEWKREESGRRDVAIVRIEQLYPLPLEELRAALDPVAEGTPAFWVQEEPENMGASYFIRVRLGERLFGRFPLSVISRPESASPAAGSASVHKKEQERLIAAALGG